MHSLFPPLIVGTRQHAGGSESRSCIEAGVSDNLYAIDVETGEVDLEEALHEHLDASRHAADGAAAFSVPAASPQRR